MDIKSKVVTNKHIVKQAKEQISNMEQYKKLMDLLK